MRFFTGALRRARRFSNPTAVEHHCDVRRFPYDGG
jgi:hypothetical protein